MEWKDIRKQFIAVRKELQLDQTDIQGVAQPLISKLESNTKLGPQVETFVKAVEGMGLTLSQFFLQVERQTKADSNSDQQSRISTPPQFRALKIEGDGGRSLSETRKDRLRSLIFDLGATFLAVATRLNDAAREQTPATRPQRSGSGSHDRKTG